MSFQRWQGRPLAHQPCRVNPLLVLDVRSFLIGSADCQLDNVELVAQKPNFASCHLLTTQLPHHILHDKYIFLFVVYHYPYTADHHALANMHESTPLQ